MEFKWKQKEKPDEKIVSSLEKSLSVPHKIAWILAQRGITSYDEAENYFRPKLSDLHDPFLMKDMVRPLSAWKLL